MLENYKKPLLLTIVNLKGGHNMIPKEKLSKIFGASVITLLLFITISTTVTGSFNEKTQLEIQPEKPMLPSAGGSYDGHLKVYLVEPESRWNDYS